MNQASTHDFVSFQSEGESCDFCSKIIWGTTKTGLKCQNPHILLKKKHTQLQSILSSLDTINSEVFQLKEVINSSFIQPQEKIKIQEHLDIIEKYLCECLGLDKETKTSQEMSKISNRNTVALATRDHLPVPSLQQRRLSDPTQYHGSQQMLTPQPKSSEQQPQVATLDKEMSLSEQRSFLTKRTAKRNLLVNLTLDQATHILKELVSTEEIYLKDLHIVVNVYSRPLVKLGLLTHEEAKTIFINIEELIPISEELLEKLKQMDISQPTTCPVGSIFLSMLPKFDKYILYCQLQSDSVVFVRQLMAKNKQFQKFSSDVKNQTNKLDLQDFLIKPLQRITKYPLLLNEFLKVVSPTHPDYQNIINAKNNLENLMKRTNKLKQITDNLLKKAQLDETLNWDKYCKRNQKEPIIFSKVDSLYLIYEGELKYCSKKELTLKKKTFIGYLFNGYLLLIKEDKVKFFISTSNLYALNVGNESECAFEIYNKDNNFKLTLYAKNEIDKQNWIMKINECTFEVVK